MSRVANVLGKRVLALKVIVLAAVASGLIALLFGLWRPGALADTGLGQRVSYDDSGRVVERVDAAGRSTRFVLSEADDQGRQTLVRELPDGTRVSEQYDAAGRRLALTDGAGTARYEYNDRNQLAAVRRDGDPVLRYSYDSTGRVSALDLGDGLMAAYRYDFLGRLAAIETPQGKFEIDYKTDPPGRARVGCRHPNGVETVRRFDTQGRIHSITHTGPGSTLLLQMTYDYRPDGLVGRVRERWQGESEQTIDYLYDDVGRLAAVADSKRGTTSYRYDLVGNRIETVAGGQSAGTSEFDWAGRLLRHRTENCNHDPAGNLTRWVGANGPIGCTYAVDGSLVKVERGGVAVEYAHDGDGRLCKRAAAGSQQTFVADPSAMVWRPLLATEGSRRTFFVWNGDLPMAALAGGDAEFFLTDHLGSVRLVTDGRGKLVRRLDYDPFGAPRADSPDSGFRPGFAGLFYDARAGLYLTRARAYEPTLGRFLQPDPHHRVPLGSQKDLSAYVYCGNDPVNYLDTNGADPAFADDLMGIGKAVVQGLRASRDFDAAAARDPDNSWYIRGLAGALWAGNQLMLNDEKDPLEDPEINGLLVPALAGAMTAAKPLYDAEKAMVGAVRGDPDAQTEGLRDLTKDIVMEGAGLKVIGDLEDFANTTAWLQTGTWPEYSGLLSGGTPAVPDSWTPPPANTPILDMVRPRSFARPSPARGISADPVLDMVRPRSLRAGLSARRVPTYSAPVPSAVVPYTAPVTGGGSRGVAPPSARITYDERGLRGVAPSRASGPRYTIGSDYTRPAPAAVRTPGPSVRYSYDNSASRLRLPPLPRSSPARVGGVALQGAGASLANLGDLKGIALDDNGRLVLLSGESNVVGLPPLRLDDVVTVFRCVYERGEAPFVSIDPDPNDIDGPTQLVRHDPGTAATYVGWVLFEADRVMKVYSHGQDNITRRRFRSRVAGYRDSIDLDFDFNEGGRGRIRHRLWLVPSGVARSRDGRGQLTLLDVPIRVRVERMTVRDGKLVDAPELGRSQSTETFAAWFTEHYDAIAEEAKSLPPPDSGWREPVPVFKELKRIALICAVAENLRDQGVAMPAWMRDYRVRPVTVARTTPRGSRSETRPGPDGGTLTWTVSGGAEMGAPTDQVRTVANAPAAAALMPVVKQAVAAAPSLTPVAFEHQGQRLHAVALPGNDTLELGALTLDQTDVTVPMGRGDSLSLVRHFQSFFAPNDGFGKGWTFDLPRLETNRRVTERGVKSVRTSTAWRLYSPLNSVACEFSAIKLVPELGVQLAVPDRPCDILGITGAGTDERIGVPTEKVRFRDGRRWHFDAAGRLMGVEAAAALRVFRYDAAGRLEKLEGWLGKERRAEIRLTYDAQGRVATAGARDGITVRYVYANDDCLLRVEGPDSSLGYEYRDGLVTAVREGTETVRRFEYASGGRLRAEYRGDSRIDYTLINGPDGPGAAVAVAGVPGAEETTRYDTARRLVSRRSPDGTRVDCKWDPDGGVEATLSSPGGGSVVLTRSADGQQESVRLPSGVKVRADCDTAGRPRTLFAGSTAVLKLAYRTDGQLESAVTDNCAVSPRYQDGLQTATVITPPAGLDAPSREWLQIDYDADGRLSKLSDSAGSSAAVRYDSRGRPETIAVPGGEVKVKRDDRDRITSIDTPWRVRYEKTFAADGSLQAMRAVQGRATEVTDLEQGLVSRVQGFDGAQTRLTYEPAEGSGRRVQRVRAPSGLELSYEYGPGNRLAAVNCGSVYRLEYAYDAAGRLTGWSQKPLRSPRSPWE